MASKKILSIFILGIALVTCGNSPAQAGVLNATSEHNETPVQDTLLDFLNSLYTLLNGFNSNIATTEPLVTGNNYSPDIFEDNFTSEFKGVFSFQGQGQGQNLAFVESAQPTESEDSVVFNVYYFNVYPNTETETLTVSNTESDVEDTVSNIGSTVEESVPVEPVPEPLTILGAGVAVAFGTLFKRELSNKKKKST
ncbi:PEP-CTERM sorting domain-containing protein [Cyanothece sp. BG0011]|uniref:PEP-CTERM sorting domain-containing protein n=1 Tax=Cyanothece sp. BG0011 TaxID=2082950 RepID=UPI0018E53D6A|nr:PEP-CTERM sorting domain-containing protein [Cyanothece sp. BG0011]